MEAKREAGKEIELMGSEIETEMEMEMQMDTDVRRRRWLRRWYWQGKWR